MSWGFKEELSFKEELRLVQNVTLKLEKINMVFVKPVMVKHPSRIKLVKPVTVISATHT